MLFAWDLFTMTQIFSDCKDLALQLLALVNISFSIFGFWQALLVLVVSLGMTRAVFHVQRLPRSGRGCGWEQSVLVSAAFFLPLFISFNFKGIHLPAKHMKAFSLKASAKIQLSWLQGEMTMELDEWGRYQKQFYDSSILRTPAHSFFFFFASRHSTAISVFGDGFVRESLGLNMTGACWVTADFRFMTVCTLHHTSYYRKIF